VLCIIYEEELTAILYVTKKKVIIVKYNTLKTNRHILCEVAREAEVLLLL
jgi:hypothetical protein